MAKEKQDLGCEHHEICEKCGYPEIKGTKRTNSQQQSTTNNTKNMPKTPTLQEQLIEELISEMIRFEEMTPEDEKAVKRPALIVKLFIDSFSKLLKAQREETCKVIEGAKLDKVPHDLKINPTAWLFADRIVKHTKKQLINTLTPKEDE